MRINCTFNTLHILRGNRIYESDFLRNIRGSNPSAAGCSLSRWCSASACRYSGCGQPSRKTPFCKQNPKRSPFCRRARPPAARAVATAWRPSGSGANGDTESDLQGDVEQPDPNEAGQRSRAGHRTGNCSARPAHASRTIPRPASARIQTPIRAMTAKKRAKPAKRTKICRSRRSTSARP